MITPVKHEKIFLHANSELCSSRVGLFQANFVFFQIFYNFCIPISSFLDGPDIILHAQIMRGVTPP